MYVERLKRILKSQRNHRELTKINYHRKLLLDDRYSDPRCLTRHGYKNFSQFDEDGIINEIFNRIGTKTKTFVEIGIGNGLECNTHSLLYQGFSGVWIEGAANFVDDAKKRFQFVINNGQLKIMNEFVDVNNINKILEISGIKPEIDLLSLDIDGNDFHILRNITAISPRVIVLEYNAKYQSNIDWVMEYNSKHISDKTSYFGASLKAFENLMIKKGYNLVGCSVTGANAFFVRKDLISEEIFLPPFTSEKHFEDCKYSLAWEYRSGLKDGVGAFTNSKNLLSDD
jgi:hypothetical protein